LLPLGTAYSPGFASALNLIFDTEIAHVLGHLFLFALTGAAALHTFPRLQSHPQLFLGLTLGAGILQELLQLATFKMRPPMADEFLDIGIDLLGAAVALRFTQKAHRAP
jgi:hypothetical protein